MKSISPRSSTDVPRWRIPLSEVEFGYEERLAAERVLASSWLTMGPELAAFEREFASFQRCEHAVAVSSGTAALHLSFLALGIAAGDEIIQPALNFVAAANMTVACGATPVFADIIHSVQPVIDPLEVEKLLSKRTKAVVVMHYGGNVSRMDELTTLCERHGVALIEDACHAIGVVNGSKAAGSIGDIGAFSFFGNKNLVTGEGGMAVTNSDDLADKVRRLRSHGMTSLTWDRYRGLANGYDVLEHGYNYRLDDLRAAIGRVQLRKLRGNNERRRTLMRIYRDRILGLPGWTMPFSDNVDQSSGHLMVVLAPDPRARAEALRSLEAARVQTSLHYPCIADLTAFKGWQRSNLPQTKDFVTRAITLPLYPGLSLDQVETIVAAIATSIS